MAREDVRYEEKSGLPIVDDKTTHATINRAVGAGMRNYVWEITKQLREINPELSSLLDEIDKELFEHEDDRLLAKTFVCAFYDSLRNQGVLNKEKDSERG